MALIKEVNGLAPKWGKNCYFSENATIVGEVTMGDECSVWFNAVVRGDVAYIKIGDRTNVQDGACLHTTYKIGPLNIGSDVTIGHNATVHACTIHDHCLIGMGSTLLDNCEIALDRPTMPPTTWPTWIGIASAKNRNSPQHEHAFFTS